MRAQPRPAPARECRADGNARPFEGAGHDKNSTFIPLFARLESSNTRAQAIRSETFWIEICRARGLPLLNKKNLGCSGPKAFSEMARERS